MLQGIQFVTNATGEKTAVLIDLKQYGEIWEDFYNVLIARQRAEEPRESLESVRKKLQQQGKLENTETETRFFCKQSDKNPVS